MQTDNGTCWSHKKEYDEGRHCEVFLTNRFKSGDEMLTPATCRLLLILLVQRSVFLVKEMPWQD